MPAAIVPFTEDLTEAVKAFNDRLRSAGSPMVFPDSPVPDWLPKVNGRPLYQEYFLAVDAGVVRGGYILKRQPFAVNGQVMTLAQYRLPLSEGQFDKQYASLGVQLYLDAMRREPNLYTVGIGGYQETFAKLLVSAGWQTSTVPFYFRVLHPATFLRNIAYLRTRPARRLAMDSLAATGLGWLAIHAFQAYKTRSRPRDVPPFAAHEITDFGPWADELWQAALPGYSLIALRDATILNILYPADDKRWIRLRVESAGRTVGWCVLLNVPMRDHNYFGDMRVGSLIDGLALSGFESAVTGAAMHYLQQHRADIVVTNLSHANWQPALAAAGFYEGPSNFIFAASKKVAKLLDPFAENCRRVHMTRGDGAGPENLLAAVKYANQQPPVAAST